MITLGLGKSSRARIWLGDIPAAEYPVAKVLRRNISLSGTARPEYRQAAIEVFIPHGGRFSYGLLGGHWSPDETNQLRVAVGVASKSNKLFHESLATHHDTVHIGLLEEYGHIVLGAIEVAARNQKAPGSGELRINCAAYGEIGSNASVFTHLAAALVNILSAPAGDLSDEALAAFFREEFFQPPSL